MTKTAKERRDRLMPEGIPRWVRCYDNGGPKAKTFCRKCYTFYDTKQRNGKCPDCDHNLIAVEKGTVDRYTVVFTGRYKGRPRGWVQYRGMCCEPCKPWGHGMWAEFEGVIDGAKGQPPAFGARHQRPPGLGDQTDWDSRRIPFEKLAPACQELIIRDYKEMWGLA